MQPRGRRGVPNPLPMRVRPSIPFLLDLLRMAMRKQASAVYIVPWMPPTLRIDEHSVPLSSVAFTPEQATLLVLDMLDDAHRAALDHSREIQFSFVLDDVGRFRVHAFRRHGQPAMAIRPFAIDVPTPHTLALPALACTAALADRGLLVLASRSARLRREGLAALLEHRNRQGSGELVLLDDATRFWHERVRCQVRPGVTPGAVEELLQRRAARAPGVAASAGPLAIAWGELRDGPQLERAVRSADRALCLVTLDADDLPTALHRLISLSAEAGGQGLRHKAAIAINGVLALRPVQAAADGRDLAATEVLLTSPDLAANLAEGDLDALRKMVSPPAGPPVPHGSTGADEHLWQLVQQGLVTAEVALQHAIDPQAFSQRSPTPAADSHARPATAPVTVDTGFADLFDPAARTADPFDFAEPPPVERATDTQFDSVDWADEVSAAPFAAEPPPPPLQPPRAPLPHSAQFHAWAPAAVVPGNTVAIDLWVALPAQAAEVAERARQASAATVAVIDPADPAPVVALQLRIDGVLPASTTLRLAWHARPERVRFAVPVPSRTRAGPHAARVRLSVGGLPFGELSFVLNVMPNANPHAPHEDTQAARRMLQSAYAAYAPGDRDEVLASLQTLQLVAPGLTVYTDAPRLRSSENWRERIERELGSCERVFLFWSSAAAESPWVDFEWRLMMRRRGSGAIDALLLEPPRLAPLPAELADLASVEVRVRAVPAEPAPSTRRGAQLGGAP